MGFFVFGINHKDCPVEIREKLHFDQETRQNLLSKSKLVSEINELVVLSTCNRVEFYGHAEKGEAPFRLIYDLIEATLGVSRSFYQAYVHLHEGKDAIHHIFRVAAGLESLVVGENEILKQMRESFQLANQVGTIHSLLYRLMEKSLKVGKDVRHQTKINQGAVGIASVAVELAEKIFGKLSKEKVMVIGTGEMGSMTLCSLRSAGAEILYVVSRAQELGEKVATEFGASWLQIDSWKNHLAEVDIIITSTASPEPIILHDTVTRIMEKRRYRPLFMVDIAVPRDIENSVNDIDDVYLYNIDDLKGVADANLALRKKEVRQADEVVEQSVMAFSSWLEQLSARPTLARFENFLDDILDEELEFALKDKDQLNQIKSRIRSKMLYSPIERIKEASQNGGVKRYLEALHSLFKLDKNEE